MHVAKKRFVSQGIKLSAEVKPFVPKHAAVTVAWSEPSEACVFPRYLTTCYPFVQEPSLDKYVYFLNLISWGILTFWFWTVSSLTKSRFQYIFSPTVEVLLHYLHDLVFYIYVLWAYTGYLVFCSQGRVLLQSIKVDLVVCNDWSGFCVFWKELNPVLGWKNGCVMTGLR